MTGASTAVAVASSVLIAFIRVKRTLEVLRAPTDRRPRWDHQRANLRSLANVERDGR